MKKNQEDASATDKESVKSSSDSEGYNNDPYDNSFEETIRNRQFKDIMLNAKIYSTISILKKADSCFKAIYERENNQQAYKLPIHDYLQFKSQVVEIREHQAFMEKFISEFKFEGFGINDLPVYYEIVQDKFFLGCLWFNSTLYKHLKLFASDFMAEIEEKGKSHKDKNFKVTVECLPNKMLENKEFVKCSCYFNQIYAKIKDNRIVLSKDKNIDEEIDHTKFDKRLRKMQKIVDEKLDWKEISYKLVFDCLPQKCNLLNCKFIVDSSINKIPSRHLSLV